MQAMRWRMKLTQQQFGELLGVTKATICHWERGNMSKVARRMVQLQLENERLKLDIERHMREKIEMAGMIAKLREGLLDKYYSKRDTVDA
jgi:DNA-binding XRE family transcriptional regulator